MAGNDIDVAASIGAPELAAPAPQAAPVPQGTPGGLDPRVVWTVGGEALGDMPGRQAVASVVRNRIAAGAPDAVSAVSEPGQFKAYGSLDATAKRFPVGSPQYQALESQIAPIISGAQPPIGTYTGFRTHGYQSPGTPWNGSAPITTIGGNDFATVPYKYSGAPTPDVGASIGLTADEQAKLAPYAGPGADPNNPAAAQPGSKSQFNFGPQFGSLSAAAVPTFQKILEGAQQRRFRSAMGNAAPLRARLSFPGTSRKGSTAPTTAGDHWVDVNGKEHVNPGGAGTQALNDLDAAFQGTAGDLGTSLTRMTGGVFGVGTPASALGAANQEERNYALQHRGDTQASAVRFLGPGALGPLRLHSHRISGLLRGSKARAD